MTRPCTLVRPVEEGEWAALADLWERAADELPRAVESLGRRTTPERLRAVLDRSGVVCLVAVTGERVVGIVVLTASPLSGLVEDPSMTVEVLYVLPELRGRGVGATLLAKAASVAESLGVTQIASTAPAGLRDANRFYARLGFSAAVTRRVAPTAALRRRLAGDEDRATDRVLARRRSLRARARATGLRGVGAFADLAETGPRAGHAR